MARAGVKDSAHRLITVGKPKAPYIAQGLADYAGRLKAYGGCQLLHLKAERAAKGKTPARLMAAEGQRIQPSEYHLYFTKTTPEETTI